MTIGWQTRRLLLFALNLMGMLVLNLMSMPGCHGNLLLTFGELLSMHALMGRRYTLDDTDAYEMTVDDECKAPAIF